MTRERLSESGLLPLYWFLSEVSADWRENKLIKRILGGIIVDFIFSAIENTNEDISKYHIQMSALFMRHKCNLKGVLKSRGGGEIRRLNNRNERMSITYFGASSLIYNE